MTQPLPASWVKTVIRGDDRQWTEFFEENTGTVDAPVWEPKDLSGYTFLSQIRADPDSTDLMATITVTHLTDGTDGMLLCTLPHMEADNLVPGKVYADLQLTRTSDGFRQTYLSGKWTVKPDVSRP